MAVWAGRGSNWGRIHACAHCQLAGQALAQGWVEVPPDDSWALELEPGLGVVVRGPARFEVAGPKPGEWRFALSRGRFFAQSAGRGKVVTLLRSDHSMGIEGATASTGPVPSRMDLDASETGNSVVCGTGSVTLMAAAGTRMLEPAGHWESGKPTEPAPPPTAQEQGWLDELTRR